MEYQKIINVLDNTLNEPIKFRTKQITNSQIKCKTSKLRFKFM